jgi:predicted outer membrane lipoprotein
MYIGPTQLSGFGLPGLTPRPSPPSPPPTPPACAFDIRNAVAIEQVAARNTLTLSAQVATGDPLAGGLTINEVYGWRAAAWDEARRRLGQ